MKILIISGNPKKDGLCQSVVEAAVSGAKDSGAAVEEIRLCETEIARCHVCGEGWGPCRKTGTCAYGGDGFFEVSEKIAAAAIILATPVYFHETSEALKSFIDRFRRCNFGENGRIMGKQALLIASAGGSGNGLISCLERMESFCKHTGAAVFDFIGVNRWNSDYKRKAAFSAARAMSAGRKNGDTV